MPSSLTGVRSAQRHRKAAGAAAVLGPPAQLEERRAALDQVLVDLLLDRLAHLLGKLEHQAPVVGRLRAVAGGVDRLAELDTPARRERDRAERAEQWECRRDREVG